MEAVRPDNSCWHGLDDLRPAIHATLARRGRGWSEIDDIVQETLLRAWKSRASLDDRSRLKPWLCTIASREHARMYERKRLPTDRKSVV